MVYVLDGLFELAVEMIFWIFWLKICLVEFEIKLWKLMKIDCTPCWFSLLWCELLRFWIKSEKYLEHNISKMFCQIFSIFNVSKSMLCSSAVKRNWRNYEIHVLRKCSLKFIEKQKMNKKPKFFNAFCCFLMDAWLIMNDYMRTIRVPMPRIIGKNVHCCFDKVFHRFLLIKIFQHFPSPCYLIFIRILESALISNHNQAGIIDIYKEEKQIIDNYFRFIYSPNKKDAYYGIETMLCRSRFHRLRLPSNMIKKISETFRKKYKIKHILVERE